MGAIAIKGSCEAPRHVQPARWDIVQLMSISPGTAVELRFLTILHVIPTLEGGGAERQLSMLAAEQTRRGYQVHVAVRRPGVHAQAIRDGRVEVHELGNIRSIDPRLFLALKQ